ncbi:MAG: glycosyltransferase [Cryobacterium sp.]|nr:glycosyltransferase [Cryobacterium sp.]
MRVMLFAESFLPHMNGVTNSLLHALKNFERQGHEALVVAPHYDTDDELPTSAHGAPILRLPSLALPAYPQVRVAAAGMRRLGNIVQSFAPDVVHLASPFVLGWQGVRAAERAGLPSVAVYQTDVPGYAARYGVPGAAQLMTSHLIRLHERATMTLAPSRVALEDLERIGIPRVGVWGRGVDSERFTPRRRSERLRASLAPNGEVIVGYVGRLAPEKQVDDLVVLADLPNVKLVIVGDGPSRAELEAKLPTATFLGFKGGDELGELVASFDIFVHTGEHETFCQTVQEALASGVPVVAVGRGGPVELVQSSRTGWLYRPGDLADLRARVADLAGDAGKRAAFASAALASVAGRSWAATVDQLVGHYGEAIDAVRTGRAVRIAPHVAVQPAVQAAPPASTTALGPTSWARYVALGDSLTEGLCDTSRMTSGEYRGWADRLSTLLAHGRADHRLEFANLAIRSKRTDEVLADQVPVALRLKPDLVSVLVGANDLVRFRAAPLALADRLGHGIRALTASGATVLVIGVFAPRYPALAGLRRRIRAFNERLQQHCREHGALYVDFDADPTLAEPSSWAEDRVHLSSKGHRALCYHAAAALGVPGAQEVGALDRIMHDDPPPALEEWSPTAQWVWTHVRPWLGRRMLGRRAGDGREPKHSVPVPVVSNVASGIPTRES